MFKLDPGSVAELSTELREVVCQEGASSRSSPSLDAEPEVRRMWAMIEVKMSSKNYPCTVYFVVANDVPPVVPRMELCWCIRSLISCGGRVFPMSWGSV